MSLLIFTFQKHRIISEKSSINYKLMNLRNKLIDLQNYAASVSDGNITAQEMMDAPSAMFGRMSIFLQYSNASAKIGADRDFMFMKSQNAFSTQNLNPQLQAGSPQQGALQNQMESMVYSKLYEQQVSKVAEQEKTLLHAQETKINQQIAQMETKLKMLESEEQKVTDAESKAAEKSAPSYVA